MESTRPDDPDSARKASAAVATAEPHADVARDVPPSPEVRAADAPHFTSPSSARDRCGMCGAALAPDQRYCVECGQRCGPANLPFSAGQAPQAPQAPGSERRPRRSGLSVNSTLVAIIGILLLAVGVGVLIGRSGSGTTSAKAPAVQVVTVPGPASAAGTAGGEAPAIPTGATGAAGTGKAGTTTATKAAKAATKALPKVPAPVVKVGSPGKGPGYQHGHFTGNFFGG
jgi:hypothetical protein